MAQLHVGTEPALQGAVYALHAREPTLTRESSLGAVPTIMPHPPKLADEQVVIKADRAHSEEWVRMPNMNLSHSKFIPLSVLDRALTCGAAGRVLDSIKDIYGMMFQEGAEGVTTNAGITGEQYKVITSQLTDLRRQLFKANDRRGAMNVSKVQKVLDDRVEESLKSISPDALNTFRKAREQWGGLRIAEDAINEAGDAQVGPLKNAINKNRPQDLVAREGRTPSELATLSKNAKLLQDVVGNSGTSARSGAKALIQGAQGGLGLYGAGMRLTRVIYTPAWLPFSARWHSRRHCTRRVSPDTSVVSLRTRWRRHGAWEARSRRCVSTTDRRREPLDHLPSRARRRPAPACPELTGGGFAVDVSEETLRCTTLGECRAGVRVNLEKALCPGGRLGGHFVTGHVDGIGTVAAAEGDPDAGMRVAVPETLVRYLARKGSVCVDRISLTVNRIEGREFEVHLIPHTLSATIAGSYSAGTRVNIEVDLLARYVESLLSASVVVR